MGRSKPKQKISLPPDLPPDVSDEEIEVSDEDLQFLNENVEYAGFVSRLDTQSITKHVSRVADVKEDALEALYEKRLKKKLLQKENEKETVIEVDRVDALPIKTADGKLLYRTVPKVSKVSEEERDEDDKDAGMDDGIVKLTKAERRAKLKKLRKEAKKQGKALPTTEEVQQPPQAPQAAVLAEVKEDLTAEEVFESKKHKLAELGMALLSDPESNIKSLKEILEISRDENHTIIKLGMLSLLAVFKDIIPGYRIRLPTEKEMEMKVSKEVKKMRFYESTLLSSYKAYLLKLLALEKQPLFQQVAVRCICSLLDAVPHFNFRDSLLESVVKNIGSPDDVVRRLCCSTIKSLFTSEGKHGGEATVEAVRLIADLVKAHNCQLHPESIEVFLSLYFDEHIGKAEVPDKNDKGKFKKNRKRKNVEEPNQLQENKGKKNKKEMMTKMREEVAADYKAVAFTPDVSERRKMQSETLSAVFEIYFRILKNTLYSTAPRSEANLFTVASESHPLLAPCLDGLGKFSHLIDMDFMADLMNHLRKLASGGIDREGSEKCLRHLTVSERLRCCIVAFKVMRNNLDALNVDLQDFFVQLYNIILEYRPGRELGEILAEALKLMLCEDRQRDMQKTAAFVKRLATFSLCFGSAEAMTALVTLKNLLLKNVKCRNLLENDAGGGSVSGSINAKYQPFASDPNLSGALASVLWELNLLSKHYHSSVSTMALGITGMSNAENQVHQTIFSPIQAFKDLSIEHETFTPTGNMRKLNSKRKKGIKPSISATTESVADTDLTEDEVKKKLSEHFTVLRDIKENERLRSELDRASRSLHLYEEYKKQKTKQKGQKPRKCC